MSVGAWEEYLAAARRLDAARRDAAEAAGEHARLVQAAREEATRLRARLAPQQARLRDLGVAATELQPSDEELRAAAQRVTGEPAEVLAVLHQARAMADSADASLTAHTDHLAAPDRAWLRNLLVYGPYALVVLVVQSALYLLADAVSLPALLCGLTMPAIAFGLGWLTIGLLFSDRPAVVGGRVDRTPLLGAAVCIVAPILLSCVGAVAFRLLG
ncbi:MAG TPA: hypothetical protein VF174_16775 [Micromonosporaceae bacterium]